ncbi:MAG: type II toxin-antitoxin system VapC family toxin [Desulfobacteraceae bacterium]|nr:type II toxin-antitoxin system VapC family toxin [Desulfobacteraceae bacterium]
MFLLDTDTIIYALKGEESVRANLAGHRLSPMAVSTVTLMELYYGACKSQNVDANLAKVKMIESTFEIIPPGPETGEIFGRLKAGLEAQGRPLADLDLIIAATALTRNFTLVTNNQRHFQRVQGLKLANWR